MIININEITRSFAPKISHYYITRHFRIGIETEINSDVLYEKMKKLTGHAYPSSLPSKEKNDTRWEYFYLPIKRNGRLICTPIWVMLYESRYSVRFLGIDSFPGYLVVDKGNDEIPGDYTLFIDEATRFIPVMKETDNHIIEKTYPYNYRKGKIRMKYFLNKEKLMSEAERIEIETAYRKHIEKNQPLGSVSLNDYLKTAAICYQGAFKERTDRLTPLEMYKRWADNRHYGMLDIDPDSTDEFDEWLNKGNLGSHPFEIVYSHIKTGIHLYPPGKKNPFYHLSLSNTLFNDVLIKMVVNLVKHDIPFRIHGLENYLDYLTGESIVDVNGIDLDTFNYYHSNEYRKKYFPYIQWDEIKVLKWK